MTGNDIVDMATAAVESNWQRKGFLQKIFTHQEQQYICNAPMPEQRVWRLWSMKESAYKIYTQQFGGRFFAPQHFSCTLLTENTGNVVYKDSLYLTNTIVTKDYIYSTARPLEFTNLYFINHCCLIPQNTDSQQFIRNKIIDNYHSITGKPCKTPTILKKKNGIPFLYCGNNLHIPVSITHHGRFAAFTIH